MFIYLLDSDFAIYLSDADAATLSIHTPEYAELAEILALAEVRQALYAFDTSKELSPWQAYVSGTGYLKGTRVIADSVPHYAIQDAGTGIAISDTDYWVQGDSRLPALLNIVIRLTIYYLASRLNMGPLPPSLAEHATDARKWLADQTSGLIPALFPRLADVPTLPFGSNTALSDGGTIWH